MTATPNERPGVDAGRPVLIITPQPGHHVAAGLLHQTNDKPASELTPIAWAKARQASHAKA
ncbi:MAG: hypothetical protein ACK5GN_12030 [Pseudomonadota bacterium]|jgi:hypothetical protein